MEAVGGRFPPPPCVFSGLRLASRSPQRRQVWWLPALLFWNLWVACGGVSRGWGGSLRCCGQHPPWSVKLLEPRGGPALHRAVPELGGAAGTVGTRCSGAVARSGQQGRVGLPGPVLREVACLRWGCSPGARAARAGQSRPGPWQLLAPGRATPSLGWAGLSARQLPLLPRAGTGALPARSLRSGEEGGLPAGLRSEQLPPECPRRGRGPRLDTGSLRWG